MQNAEAEKEAAKLNGEGVAAERTAIFAGFQTMVKGMEDAAGVTASEALKVTMYMQYIDALNKLSASPNAKVLAFPLSASASSTLMDQLNSVLLQGGEATKVNAAVKDATTAAA